MTDHLTHVPEECAPTSMAESLRRLNVGGSFVIHEDIDPMMYGPITKTVLSDTKAQLRATANNVIRHFKGSGREFSMESCNTLLPSGRVFAICVITRDK